MLSEFIEPANVKMTRWEIEVKFIIQRVRTQEEEGVPFSLVEPFDLAIWRDERDLLQRRELGVDAEVQESGGEVAVDQEILENTSGQLDFARDIVAARREDWLPTGSIKFREVFRALGEWIRQHRAQ
eukprot:evm.model.scf_3711.1 EVM.evm.TU.scf_3711.1   scf_3711:4398-4803(-)